MFHHSEKQCWVGRLTEDGVKDVRSPVDDYIVFCRKVFALSEAVDLSDICGGLYDRSYQGGGAAQSVFQKPSYKLTEVVTGGVKNQPSP